MGPARFSIDIKVLKDLRRHLADGARGGQAPALRAHRDWEVSPTGEAGLFGVSRNPFDNNEL